MRKALALRGVVRKGLLIRAALGLTACALTWMVYIPFADGPFVLDDRTMVLLNSSLSDVSDWRGVLLYDRWHPLVNASFAIDRALWGFSSLGFRLTNTALHLAVVALLFGVCTRLCEEDWTAFLAAAAFGINPLTVRSAAYVSARSDLLFTAGALIVVILVRRAVDRSDRQAAVLAGIAAGLTLTATPWGAATHGPLRLYVPAAAAAVAAAWAASELVARSRVVRVAGVLVVGALIAPTRTALVRWSDPVGLWRDEVQRRPDAWDAHLGYADALRESARCGDAAAEYREALTRNPQLDAARRGLASCGAR
jgi:hypothetical protein